MIEPAANDAAIAQLLGSTSGALALLSLATEPAAPASLRERAASAATAHTNVFARDLFQRLLPPEKRRRMLGSEFPPEIVLALKGDATRGRSLFLGSAQCSRCHVIEGQGRMFGPDLAGISRKYSRAQLFEQVVNPSKIVVPEFKTTMLTLRDGREMSGFVIRQSGTEIVLKDENLAERVISMAEVAESRESVLSAMPEGLLATLTAQEAADLLDFLATTKPVR